MEKYIALSFYFCAIIIHNVLAQNAVPNIQNVPSSSGISPGANNFNSNIGNIPNVGMNSNAAGMNPGLAAMSGINSGLNQMGAMNAGLNGLGGINSGLNGMAGGFTGMSGMNTGMGPGLSYPGMSPNLAAMSSGMGIPSYGMSGFGNTNAGYSYGGFGYNGMTSSGFGNAGLQGSGMQFPTMPGAYGGYGNGDIKVAGDLPVAGTTTVNGQVPIMGAVEFGGNIPAGGVVTITGSCGCPCKGGF